MAETGLQRITSEQYHEIRVQLSIGRKEIRKVVHFLLEFDSNPKLKKTVQAEIENLSGKLKGDRDSGMKAVKDFCEDHYKPDKEYDFYRIFLGDESEYEQIARLCPKIPEIFNNKDLFLGFVGRQVLKIMGEIIANAINLYYRSIFIYDGDIYFWPGYERISKTKGQYRFVLKDSDYVNLKERKEVQCGLGTKFSGNDRKQEKKHYYNSITSLAFDKILIPTKEMDIIKNGKETKFLPGGTHDWVTMGDIRFKEEVIGTEPDMELLSIRVDDEKVSEENALQDKDSLDVCHAETTIDNRNGLISIQLRRDKSSKYKWGSLIASELNENNKSGFEVGSNIIWPYNHEPGNEIVDKDIQEIREELYSIWLLLTFSPGSVDEECVKWIGRLQEKYKEKGSKSLVGNIKELLDLLAEIRKDKDKPGNHHNFKNWYTLRLMKTMSPLSIDGNDKENGRDNNISDILGSAMILASEEIHPLVLLEIKKWVESAYLSIRDLESTYVTKASVEEHSSKAAIVSIMSRNLSHNLGSHVLAYWKNELTNKLQWAKYEEKNKRDDLEKSKNLFEYIQNRMDFIAELSTSVPSSELALDFENDIFKPIFDPESKKSVLLDNITKSERVGSLHGRINLEIEENEELRYVSIPNGLVGVHAVYSILENFIRNSAKHYRGDDNPDVIINVILKKPEKEYEDEYVLVKIFDVRANSCYGKLLIELKRFYPGGEHYKPAVGGVLKSGGWGVNEIVACANFLRKRDAVLTYDDLIKTAKPPIVELICDNYDKLDKENSICADCSNPEGFEGKLGIQFYLRKPKHLGVLVKPSKMTGEKIENGEPKNVFAIEDLDLREYENKEFPHKMILVKDKGMKDKFQKNSTAPCRVMFDGKGKLSDKDYLLLYERFIKEEICYGEKLELPKILYTDGAAGKGEKYVVYHRDYRYDRIRGDKSALKDVIVFYNHLKSERKSDKFNYYFDNSQLFLQHISGAHNKHKFDNIVEIQNECIKDHFCLEIIESALTKVVILDERISGFCNDENVFYSNEGYEVSIRDALKKMRIFVIDYGFNREGKKTNYDDLYKSINKQCVDKQNHSFVFNSKQSNNAHFFVIHQGILDKMEKSRVQELLDKIKCRWIVVDSGRGVPQKLSNDVRFVEMSVLQKMLENYDKHGIVQTLMASRWPMKDINK